MYLRLKDSNATFVVHDSATQNVSEGYERQTDIQTNKQTDFLLIIVAWWLSG